jgi:glycine betaine/proline transport system substrate-binding protein
MQTNLETIDQSEVTSAATNLPEATFSVAVNEEACEAGVRSHEDLDQYKDRFDATIFGIEHGNDGNQVVRNGSASAQTAGRSFSRSIYTIDRRGSKA